MGHKPLNLDDEADFWLTAALALTARRQVGWVLNGRRWITRDGLPWCTEMSNTLQTILARGLIQVQPRQDGYQVPYRAEITSLGSELLLSRIDPRLHRAVIR